jgi:hypothetical protein
MAEASTFRNTLLFFDKLGIYDVILPFLLVFTIIFAILEKTKVLGTEAVEGQTITKKNLNAMVAFVVSFLTIASSHLVAIINKTAGHVVILLLVSVFFLMLVGSFWQEGDKSVFLTKGWNMLFMLMMFIGVVLIFLNAITYEGKSWLSIFFKSLGDFNNSEIVSSIVLIVIVLFFMWFVVKSPNKTTGNGKG